MAFDSWGILPGLEEDEFVLAFGDSSPDQGKPFIKMGDPMSEEEILEALKKNGVSDGQAHSAILKAKVAWKKKR